MKSQRYKKELAGLKDRVKLLEELIEKEKRFEDDGHPKFGEIYYYIGVGETGKIMQVVLEQWSNCESDIYYWDFCHGSTNEAKVKWTIEHIKLINELKKHTRPFKDGEYNVSFYKDCIGRVIRKDGSSRWERASEYDYFDSKEKAQEVVDSLGEDYVAKFLFKPIDGNYKTVMDWLEKNNQTKIESWQSCPAESTVEQEEIK